MPTEIAQAQTQEFVNYLLSFYGPDSELYPEMDFTATEIRAALRIYAQGDVEFCGDSVDREFVRDIVLAQRG